MKRDREAGLDSLGIVLGGSGNGEQMAANKVDGIRAALAWNHDTAALAREHNNAQVVAVGGRQHSKEEALEIIKVSWLPPGPTRSVTHAVSVSWLSTSRPATLPASRLTLPKL